MMPSICLLVIVLVKCILITSEIDGDLYNIVVTFIRVRNIPLNQHLGVYYFQRTIPDVSFP